MSQKRHIMHGRDHLPGGADPIGTGTEVDLGRYVIAAVPLMRNLWVGGHGPEDSGDDAVTHLACPLVSALAPAPPDAKFYDSSLIPTPDAVDTGYTGNLGLTFSAITTGVQVTGVQLWRVSGGGTVQIGLWNNVDVDTPLATATGGTGSGWNEVYFDSPIDIANGIAHTVCWFIPSGAGGRIERSSLSGIAPLPKYADGYASAGPAGASAWRRLGIFDPDPGDATIMAQTGEGADCFVGPIVNHIPPPPDELYIVATAREFTDTGVHVVRTEPAEVDGVIDIYWSAADATVSVNVFVMGVDPGDMGCEHLQLLGKCLEEEE